MTAAWLLADLARRDVRIVANGDRLTVDQPQGELTSEDLELLRQHKPEILALLRRTAAGWPTFLSGHVRVIVAFTACAICAAGTWCSYSEIPLCRACAVGRGLAVTAYRAALWRCWALTNAGADADPNECLAALDDVARFTDEVGEPLADRLRHGWEAEWFAQSGRCPRCGEPESHL